MLKILIIPALFLLIIAQWLVPLDMIWKKRSVLEKGIAYKFKTRPVDPSNPFMGKYIVLNFEQNSIKLPGERNFNYNKNVFVKFSTGKDGFAKILMIDTLKPSGTDYLSTFVSYVDKEKDSSRVYLQYPFQRFYMQEYKAPKAEDIYRQENIDSSANVYALVKVYDGDAVVKEVYVNDSLISVVIKARNKVR